MSQIGNKDHKGAFLTIYGSSYDHDRDWRVIVEPLMKSERCNGDFFKACAIYEATINAELMRIENAKKSKHVNDWRANNRDWRSGYAMGERVEIIYKTANRTIFETVADREETYRGNAKKWNSRIKYGRKTLSVDLSGARAKYEEKTEQK